ncbi:hypothetical protein [Microbacterium algeriense]|uniref:hypothetical protein n=1 Tax=Microbacterium algeriense TaxID=2615184 RepID=UPI0029B7AB64|nr:hypothetical protein [Microbacterium algeriense]MDX2398858.1 hypothetical protein [Microbacterium algeriense]
MQTLFREIRREFRWITSSKLVLVLAGAVLAMTAWGAVSGATSALQLVGQFQSTLRDYQEHGEDIATALAAPSEVSGSTQQQIIANPLRYDLDQAVQGLTQMTGTGAAASALSLSALVFFPVVGFALGLFMGTHDTRSGSIAFRWPQVGLRGVVISKPLTIVLTMLALGAATAALSALASLATSPIVMGRVDALPLESFSVDGPSPSRTFAIGLLSVLIGTAFASFGLLVGVSTRNRTIVLTAFVMLYFLLPMLGSLDPRNLISLAGNGVFSFVGQFRPQTIGDNDPSLGILAVVLLLVVSAAATAPVWRMRARLPSV